MFVSKGSERGRWWVGEPLAHGTAIVPVVLARPDLECGWCEGSLSCQHVQAVKDYIAAGEPESKAQCEYGGSDRCPMRRDDQHEWQIVQPCPHWWELGRDGDVVKCRACGELLHRFRPRALAFEPPFEWLKQAEPSEEEVAEHIKAEREGCLVWQKGHVEVGRDSR